MEIKLISKTPDFLKTCWVAARTCYSANSPIELLQELKTKEDMIKLIDYIIKSNHLSVVEHCSMTFAVKNVSRTLLAQYSRHRIGMSLSVQSQRYVSEQSSNENIVFDNVLPDTITKNKESLIEYNNLMNNIQNVYNKLIELKIPKQDARFVLPGSASTNFVTSLNLRSFLDIYNKRVLIPGAQWEIKNMLIKMGELISAEEPWIKSYLVKK